MLFYLLILSSSISVSSFFSFTYFTNKEGLFEDSIIGLSPNKEEGLFVSSNNDLSPNLFQNKEVFFVLNNELLFFFFEKSNNKLL